MTNTPSGMKSIAKVPNHKAARRQKSFSFYFFFFFFRQASSKLRDSFMMVFTQNGSTLHWAVHLSIVFFNKFEVSRGASEPVTEELALHLRCHFIHVYACTQSLSNEMQLLHKIAVLEGTLGVHGVFEESLVWSVIHQPTLHTFTEEAYDRLAALW